MSDIDDLHSEDNFDSLWELIRDQELKPGCFGSVVEVNKGKTYTSCSFCVHLRGCISSSISEDCFSNYGVYGVICLALCERHVDCKRKHFADNRTKFLGFCSVDAGMIMFTDPCYVKHFDNSEVDWEMGLEEGKSIKLKKVDNDAIEDAEKLDKKPYSYAGCCAVVDPVSQGGQLYSEEGSLMGVCVGTDDGIYPVYGRYDKSGNIIAATIDFNPRVESTGDGKFRVIPEEFEEEDEEDEV